MTTAETGPDTADAILLGQTLRNTRKEQRVTIKIVAEAAGISRVTLHRIERGEQGVAIGSWLAAARVLGLRLGILRPDDNREEGAEAIRLDEFPQLKALAWHLQGAQELTPQQALALYERNWRHIDRDNLTLREVRLIDMLARTLGGGRLLVQA